MTATLVRIESEKYETADLEAVNAQLAKLHNSPLAAQLQAMIGQLRDGDDITLIRDEDMLTPAKVAELLQISRPMVLALIKRGELVDVPIGTHHRVPAREVFAYMERRDQAARAIASALARGGITASQIAVRKADVDPEIAASLGY